MKLDVPLLLALLAKSARMLLSLVVSVVILLCFLYFWWMVYDCLSWLMNLVLYDFFVHGV